jgi:hypothetical protein
VLLVLQTKVLKVEMKSVHLALAVVVVEQEALVYLLMVARQQTVETAALVLQLQLQVLQ